MKTYDTMNHMFKYEVKDKTHWINKEAAFYLKKENYSNLKVTLTHVPEKIRKINGICKNGHIYEIKWLKKELPFLVFYDPSGKKLLRQKEIRTICPICGSINFLKIPLSEYYGEIEIFGDESFPLLNDLNGIVYGFIAFTGTSDKKNFFLNEIDGIKRKMCPQKNPSDWVLHMKELTNERKRKINPHFKHLSQNDVFYHINSILELIKRYNISNDLILYSSVGISLEKKMKEKKLNIYKSIVYQATLLNIVNDFTTSGYSPVVYFERTQRDGWAKVLYKGSRICHLWPFITHGIPVKEPVFVNPQFSIFLEIADIINYILGRELFAFGSKTINRSVEVQYNIKDVGEIRYSLIDSQGNWDNIINEGFPYEKMFKNTEWEKYI